MTTSNTPANEPEFQLPDGYHVERNGQQVYVPRDQLTRAEMEWVFARLNAKAAHFAAKAEALRAHVERKEGDA